MRIRLKNLHRLSGIAIATFLLLHITNHLFALGGPSLHIAVMNFFRHVYRFPPIELVLLLCVMFQIISGIWLVFKKGFLRQPFYVVVQVLTGLYLSFFMVYHLNAVMRGRYQWHVETDFYFAAGVANQYPSKLFFIPYYTLSLICVFVHVACVHYGKRMEQLSNSVGAFDLLRKRYRREAITICTAGSIITILIMLAFGGVLYPI